MSFDYYHNEAIKQAQTKKKEKNYEIFMKLLVEQVKGDGRLTCSKQPVASMQIQKSLFLTTHIHRMIEIFLTGADSNKVEII